MVEVNDPPVVAPNPGLTVDEGGAITLTSSLLYGTDVNDDASTLVFQVTNPPAHGTLAVDGTTLVADDTFVLADIDGGAVVYSHDGSETSADGFSVILHDNRGGDSATTDVAIAVTAVNDAPVADDDDYAAEEDMPLSIDVAGGVLANDTDADGDTLTATVATDVQHGTLSLQADGSFTYTPDADFAGADAFTYTASDGTDVSAVATVTLTIAGANDAPVAVDDAYTVEHDTELVVTAAEGVLANDTDADSDTLTATLASEPEHGTLELGGDGSFSYTPDSGFSGADTFTYTVSDGTVTSSATTVTLTVAEGDSGADNGGGGGVRV